MPTYSIEINTDTGDREAGLQYVVAKYNEAVVARNAALPEGAEPEPELDAKQYLQKNFDPVIDSYAAQVVMSKTDAVKEKFERADQATRDQVESILAAVAIPAEVNEL